MLLTKSNQIKSPNQKNAANPKTSHTKILRFEKIITLCHEGRGEARTLNRHHIRMTPSMLTQDDMCHCRARRLVETKGEMFCEAKSRWQHYYALCQIKRYFTSNFSSLWRRRGEAFINSHLKFSSSFHHPYYPSVIQSHLGCDEGRLSVLMSLDFFLLLLIRKF